MSYIDLYLQDVSLTQGNKEPNLYIFGIPFDSTCSYRSGARFAPNAIREAFRNIEYNSYYNEYKLDIEALSIKDLGNLTFTVNAKKMLDMANKVSKEVFEKGFTIILGGEHLITLATYLASNYSLVVFDAHYDLRDEFTDTRYSHATFLRRIVEEKGKDDILHVGARAYGIDELEFLSKSKIISIKAKDIHNDRFDLLKDALSVLSKDVYISIDLDVFDPSYAPAVSNPEPLGLNANQFFKALNMLEDNNIKAIDIVELSPPYDNGSTAILAAKVMLESIFLNHDLRSSAQ